MIACNVVLQNRSEALAAGRSVKEHKSKNISGWIELISLENGSDGGFSLVSSETFIRGSDKVFFGFETFHGAERDL